MAKKKQKRIPIDQDASGFNDAFGGLSLEGLPSAPAVEIPESAEDSSPSLKLDCCLRRETAHRGGKSVVVVYQLPEELEPAAIDDLAKGLKQHCGSGGTVKNREIQIQGEKMDAVRSFLQDQGWRVRGS